MKAYKKPSVSKLVTRFDKQLKSILMNDLKVLKAAKNNFMQVIGPDHLTAA